MRRAVLILLFVPLNGGGQSAFTFRDLTIGNKGGSATPPASTYTESVEYWQFGQQSTTLVDGSDYWSFGENLQ